MSTDLKETISDIFRDGTAVDGALEAAARQAIRRHRQSGQPIPVWRDGKTVMVSPDELADRLNKLTEKASPRQT